MTAKENVRDYIESVLTPIIEKPQELKVDVSQDERGLFAQITSAKEDVPLIIGRRGATIMALRTLVRAVGARNNAAVSVKLLEDNNDENYPV